MGNLKAGLVRTGVTFTDIDWRLAMAFIHQKKRWKDVPAAMRDGLWQLIARNPLTAAQLKAAALEVGIDAETVSAVLRRASGGNPEGG